MNNEIHHAALDQLPRAKKRFGQNFLVDRSVIERIVGGLAPRADETIIEIGAGRGALTQMLATRAGRLIAIELDRELVPYLNDKFAGSETVVIVEADALDADFCQLSEPAQTARVVANLPYNISTAIVQRLLSQRRCIPEMVLMLQREVVERMLAAPGTSERGYLSVLIEAYCTAEKLFDVAPTSFRPAPKVWSTIVRLVPHATEKFSIRESESRLWRIVGAGFAQRRKTIANNLKNAAPELRQEIERAGGVATVLEQSRVDTQRRAETLTFAEWFEIASVLERKI